MTTLDWTDKLTTLSNINHRAVGAKGSLVIRGTSKLKAMNQRRLSSFLFIKYILVLFMNWMDLSLMATMFVCPVMHMCICYQFGLSL